MMMKTTTGFALTVCALVLGCSDDALLHSSAGNGGNSSNGSAATAMGGEDGSGGDKGPDPNPATIELVFPRGVGATVDPTAVVRGKATDRQGVDSISVNGVDAALDGDEWIAAVPLEWGQQPLSVTVTDGQGHTSTAKVGMLERSAIFDASYAVAAHGGIYSMGGQHIVRIDADGSRTGVAELVGDDQGLAWLAHDPVTDSILVLRDGNLRSYNIDSGDHTLITTSNAPPMATSFAAARGLVVDAAKHRALVVDNAVGQIVEIDLSTGDKAVFVPWHLAVFETAKSVTLDAANDRMLMIHSLSSSPNGQILAYGLSNGDREVVDFGGPTEPDITSGGSSMATDGQKVWIGSFGRLIQYEIATQKRTVLHHSMQGEPTFNSVAYVGSKLWIGSVQDGGQFFQSSTGPIHWQRVASHHFPQVQQEVDVNGVVTTAAEQQFTGQVELDLATGLHTPLPVATGGIRHRAWDENSGTLYGTASVSANMSKVLALKPASESTWTEMGTVGRPDGLVLDTARGRLLVPQSALIGGVTWVQALDIATGTVTPAFGQWEDLRAMTFNAAGDTLYALDAVTGSTSHKRDLTLFAVDPVSEIRTAIAVLHDQFAPNSQSWTFTVAWNDTDTLLFPTFASALSNKSSIRSVDVNTGTVDDWNVIPKASPCNPTYLQVLADGVVSYGGKCLADTKTSQQLVVLR